MTTCWSCQQLYFSAAGSLRCWRCVSCSCADAACAFHPSRQLQMRWLFAALSALLSASGRSRVALCDFMRHLAHISLDATSGAHILRHLAPISLDATSGAHVLLCDIWRTILWMRHLAHTCCDIWRTFLWMRHLAHMFFHATFGAKL